MNDAAQVPEEEIKAYIVKQAQNELTKWKAVKELLECDDWSATIEIHGIRVSVCENIQLLPAVKHNIAEIGKFLLEEDNKWEK